MNEQMREIMALRAASHNAAARIRAACMERMQKVGDQCTSGAQQAAVQAQVVLAQSEANTLDQSRTLYQSWMALREFSPDPHLVYQLEFALLASAMQYAVEQPPAVEGGGDG